MSATFSDGIEGNIRFGLVTAVLLVGGLGGWAATAELAGAVVAYGTVVVEGNVKKVQHPTGGVVGEVRVRDGDRVEAGDIVVRLDDTVTRANLGVITKQLDEFAVRSARLTAERDGAAGIELPAALAARADEHGIAAILAGERALLESRYKARDGQKARLTERIAQLDHEITGLTAQRWSKAREIELNGDELAGLEELYGKKLVSVTRYTAAKREAMRLEGERAHFLSAIAQAKGKIAEIGLQMIQLDQDMRTEVIKELREIQAKQAELSERRVAAEDTLKRVDIRAPIAGVVHQLSVHTVGGVINQSEPLMLIVPQADALVIEARIAPQDIDQVRTGQAAWLRFPAFSQRTTPEFVGAVARVSADLARDQQTGETFYVARIALPDAELKRHGELKLLPGMPAEVQIKTEDRSALSYLVKPLTDQVERAFRGR